MMRQLRLTGPQIVAAVVVPAVVAAALLLLLLHPAPSAGFGTLNVFGQNAEHERITRAALACTSATPAVPCFEPESITNLAGGPGAHGGVGSPDSDEIFDPNAHCDDGDHLASNPNYRRTQAQATQQLEDCWRHLNGRFQQAVAAAARLLDDSGRIRASQVDIRNTCTYFGQVSGQAKCDVLEGLGRALHGTQDFYSHSNWADTRDMGNAIGIKNPPGLNQPGRAPFLDLRAATPPALAPGLMTGCFKIRADKAPGNPDSRALGCYKRVKHRNLNKDNGEIDPVTGATQNPATPRGAVGNNFAAAVGEAIADTRSQWADLVEALAARYEPEDASLMVCALTRDDPVQDCSGRQVALVIDSGTADDEELDEWIDAARSFNASLFGAAEAAVNQQADQVALVDAGDPAGLAAPLRDPSQLSFNAIVRHDASDLNGGLDLALDEVTRVPGTPAGKGIVVFADTLVGGGWSDVRDRARAAGVRVSVALFAGAGGAAARVAQAGEEPSQEAVDAVLATGGTFAVIDSGQAAQDFVDQVGRNGVTNLDDPNGAADDSSLERGVEAFASEASGGATDSWSYRTRAGTRVIATVTPQAADFRARLTDVRTGETLDSGEASGSTPARLAGRSTSGVLELTVSATEGGGLYGLEISEAGKRIDGTGDGDRLRCGRRPAYVTAGGGRDRVRCGRADDTLDGGAGADRLDGGAGDDLFVIRRGDLRRGVERLVGGRGQDEALFLFDRPRRTDCVRGRAARVPVGGAARYRLRGIERASFEHRPCGEPDPLDTIPRDSGIQPALEPPTPSVRAESRRGAIVVSVQVDAATALLVEATVRTARGRTIRLDPVEREVRAGTHDLTLRVPRRAATGRASVTVVTSGMHDIPPRQATVQVRLRR